jgi:CO/xanthine dehydrogenase FAD-binding subunit
MDFLQPRSLSEALAVYAERPEAVPLAGGTDLMVDINFGRRRPLALLDLRRVGELTGCTIEGRRVRVGAAATYREVATALGRVSPALVAAARTVGSPQIRNRGTIGGNLGSASPAGDAIPPLQCADATVEVAGTGGSRHLPLAQFFCGPRRSALLPGELIVAVEFPVATGPQQFSKVGPRNAMVISAVSLALALWPDEGRVTASIGSAAPTVRRAQRAEEFIAGELAASSFFERGRSLDPSAAAEFARLVAAAASPIDDVRATAAYRRHALEILARRAINWVTSDWLAPGKVA